MSHLLLTSNLKQELEKTNQIFTNWVDSKMEWLNTSELNCLRQEEECNYTINALKENEKQLNELKKTNEKIFQRQSIEIKEYTEQIDKLKSNKLNVINQLKKFTEEESIETEKLNILLNEHKVISSKSDKSINDLTKGIQLFNNLGLEFQKAQNESMKFIFTQIDSKNPMKQFYFSIFVDDNDIYQFVESSPTIDDKKITKLMNELNKDSDISRFVFSMRKYYCSLTYKV